MPAVTMLRLVTPAENAGFARLEEGGHEVLLQQIGGGNLIAISGLRFVKRPTGITLPVSSGYSVTVDLAEDDTYTVRRVFTRGGSAWIKGERTGVYCDQVSDVAYSASCFSNGEF